MRIFLKIFLKNVFFSPLYEVYLAKKPTLNIQKIRKYDEEAVLFPRKKRSHLLKMHLYQTGKKKNMPVVAGRPLLICLKFCFQLL